MTRSAWLPVLALLLLAAGMASKGRLLLLPEVRPSSGAPGFDATAATSELARLLGDERPHPVDSAANDAVRTRLVRRLLEVGIRPQVTDDFSCNGSGTRGISCGRVRNVVATIGPPAGRHVLLVSHYDSSPVGPGAADDGIGTAVMLEVAAALAEAKLKRPVTFLFNEGEEAGLLGARAFLERHPIARRVDSLINLEARGVTGPALMFETSIPNGKAVGHYARAARRPSANSLSTDFYRLIPNSTDVAVFDEQPWTILNLAIIGNETRYHSPGDRLAALDRRSVQHMGDQALALVLDLANGAPIDRSGTWIFADVLGGELVLLPLELGAALLAGLIVAALWLAWRRRSGFARAALAILGALAGSAALAFAGHAFVGLLRAGDYWRGYPEILSNALSVSALFAGLAALLWIAGDVDVRRLRAAFWLIFLLIGAAIASIAPGGIIFFLLPPLVALSGCLLARRSFPRVETAASLLAALLVYLTLAPVLHLVEELLDFDAGWMFTPIAALIVLPALIELKPLAASAGRTAAIGAAALLLIASWAAAALAPAYSQDRRQPFGIEYVRAASEKTSRWMIVNDGAPLPKAIGSAFHFQPGTEVPYSNRPRWSAQAASAPAPAPGIEVLARQPLPEGREVTIRLIGGGAESLLLRTGPSAALVSAAVGTVRRRFGQMPAESDYTFRCTGRRCDGLIIDLVIGSRSPIEMTVVGTRNGLPAAAAPLLKGRPSLAGPQYSPDASIGIIRTTI